MWFMYMLTFILKLMVSFFKIIFLHTDLGNTVEDLDTIMDDSGNTAEDLDTTVDYSLGDIKDDVLAALFMPEDIEERNKGIENIMMYFFFG